MDILSRAQQLVEKSLIKKSALSTTDLATGGGLLVPSQGDKFIRMLRDRPYLLRVLRMVPMDSPTMRVDRIGFTGRILHAATENTALTEDKQSKPTTSKIELSAKESKAVVRLGYDALQDSIEGGRDVRGNSIENTVMQLILEQVALDIEEKVLLSDTASSDADLAQFDGYIKLAEASHVYDHGGLALSKSFFKKTYLEMPKPYMAKKREMIWVVSPNMEVEWSDELADQGGTEMSQKVVWGDEDVKVAYNIPLLPSSYMPSESGSSSNIGKTLLTHPFNMVLGLWRNVFMEVDRDIQAGELIVVVTVRLDAKFEQVEGTVVGKNVKVK